jgi:hypothetical protein
MLPILSKKSKKTKSGEWNDGNELNGWRAPPLPFYLQANGVGQQSEAGVQCLGAVGARWGPNICWLVSADPGIADPWLGPPTPSFRKEPSIG